MLTTRWTAPLVVLLLATTLGGGCAPAGDEPSGATCPGGRCDGFTDDGAPFMSGELCEDQRVSCTVGAYVRDCEAVAAACFACVEDELCDIATYGTFMRCLDEGGAADRCRLIIDLNGTACLESYRDCLYAGSYQDVCLPILEAEGCEPAATEPADDDPACAEGEVMVEGACVAADLERLCDDGLDDDLDGLFDCDDADCAGAPACAAPELE